MSKLDKKQWYSEAVSSEEEICDFLNKLTKEGVQHTDIKIVFYSTMLINEDGYIFYYHNEEI